MAYITVTYPFTNGSRSSSANLNRDFQDVTDGLSDGTKDIAVQSVTLNGITATTAVTNDLTLTSINNIHNLRSNLITKSKQYYPLQRPRYLNLALTDADLVGFLGGFSDGRYGYLIPYNHQKVARVLLDDFATVSVLDLGIGGAAYTGFWGGFTDGIYGYCIPYDNGAAFGRLVRFNLSDFSTWTMINLASTDAALVGFAGGFTDNRYGYLVPYTNTKVAKIDLNDFSTVQVLDTGYTGVGGFTDGVYGYYSDLSGDNLIRFKLSTFSGVEVLSVPQSIGGFIDGKYGYLICSGVSDKLQRVDLSSFTVVDELALPTAGIGNGFTDGRYVYLMPNNSGASGIACRVDLNDFSTIVTLDWTTIAATLKGYYNFFSDGVYGYGVPFSNGAAHGNVTRFLLGSGA